MRAAKFERFTRLEQFIAMVNDARWQKDSATAINDLLDGKVPGKIFSPEEYCESILRSMNSHKAVHSVPCADLDPSIGYSPDIHGEIAYWATCSRRIYAIGHDLELLLSATSTRGLSFADISLPFPIIGIQLSSPIMDAWRGSYDLILVGKQAVRHHDFGEGEIAFVRTIPADSVRYRKIDPASRTRVVDAIRKGNVSRAFRLYSAAVTTVFTDKSKMGGTYCFAVPQKDICKDLEKVQEDKGMARVLRIVFGLCKYLQMRQCNDGAKTVESTVAPCRIHLPERDKQLYGRAITKASEIWSVPCVVRLTEDERSELEEHVRIGSFEVSAHFREGHWRRPPGKGDDRTAEKTVWVRPTIVRRDRLPENALPLGSAQHISI